MFRLNGAVLDDACELALLEGRSNRIRWCDLDVHDLLPVTVRAERLLAKRLKCVICTS